MELTSMRNMCASTLPRVLSGKECSRREHLGGFPKLAFKALKNACVSFIKLQQAKGKGKKIPDNKGLETITNAYINHLNSNAKQKGPSLLDLLREVPSE
jgi:hypothetical protein